MRLVTHWWEPTVSAEERHSLAGGSLHKNARKKTPLVRLTDAYARLIRRMPVRNSGAPSAWNARERSLIDKRIWLSIHPRNFGSYVTVRRYARTSLHSLGVVLNRLWVWYLADSARETGNPRYAACVCLAGKRLSRWLKITEAANGVFLV